MDEKDKDQEKSEKIYERRLLYSYGTEIALLKQSIGFLRNDIARIEKLVDSIKYK